MSTKFLATTNTPGYLPMSDEPAVFDTAREAWAYLADERIRDEDSGFDAEPDTADEGYSSIVNTMESLGNGTLSFEEHDLCGVASTGEGTIWGPSCPPQMHDLGLNYTVSIAPPCEEGEHIVELDGEECTVCGQPTPMPEMFTINERVLTDDTVTWAPPGFTFEGGYAAVVTYHTFQNANSDEERTVKFRTVEAAEAFIVQRYGKTSDELIYDTVDGE
jgi:hypothetical protein